MKVVSGENYDIFNGDCLDGLRAMPDAIVDLTVTSPPYDNLRTYNGYSFDFENIAKELYRVTKPGGVVVWVVGDATVKGSETGTSFRQALFFKECGFRLHDTMIYLKPHCPFPDSNRYYQNFEYMFVLCKGSPKTFNPIKDRPNKWAGSKVHGTNRNKDGKTTKLPGSGKEIADFGVRFNSWEMSNPGKAGNKHPAVFPLQLALDHIQSWSNPGDVVLDPFLGSGTTGVAALQLNRNFIGFEISEEYLEICTNRIRNERPDQEVTVAAL